MPELRSLVKKIGATVAVYGQILLVFLAFTVMVISSYLYMERMMLARLEDEVNNALDFMQLGVENDLQEPEMFLQSISQSIKYLLLKSDTPDIIQGYIKEITPSVVRYEKHKLVINRLYGYFDVLNGLQLNNGEWVPTGDNNPRESPWYKAAVEAKGKVIYTVPYFNARIRSYVITYSRQILDGDTPLATIAIDVPIDNIIDYVTAMQIVEDGYGMLADEHLTILAHPDIYLIGKPLQSVNSDLAGHLVEYLELSGDYIPKSTAVNYRGLESVVYSRKLETGWYLSIIAPVKEYYSEIRHTGMVLTALGMVLALILSAILWSIAALKKKAEVKNQQKSNFLARMSHEIRTPMNAILGIAEIQLQDESLPQGVSEAFAKINSSGDLLIGIVNDILDLSKIEAGKLELMSAKYDVPSLINDTVQLNVLYYESKQIEFKLFVDEHVPLSLIGDELRIKQILNNLLSNAFKYTEKGEVSLSVTADYTQRGGAIHVPLVFRVSDTGQGMTAEQIRHLGDEYSRFNMKANRTTEGTGLGMSITMKLIEMMNGKISVESKPGKGTTVTVRLPQRNVGLGVSGTIGMELAENLQKSRIHSMPRMRKVKITRTPMPYGKVLIVDDVESNLYVAKGLMAPYGLSVETAASGFEAVEKIKGGAVFDIIFMDHMMPKMDGIEAVKIIRGLGYAHPIIALTANALSGQAEIFMGNGFDGFISKPIDIRQLNASLNKFIRDKYPPEVVEAARQQAIKINMEKAAAMEAQSVSDPELATVFARDAEKALRMLETIHSNGYRRTDDIRMFVINVHAMKSALANIGETELSAVALKLEQAGRDEDIPAMTAETPAFLEALRRVIKKNKPKEDNGDDTQEDSDSDRAYLNEKLLAIQKACEEYDEKAAKAALNELEQKKWPRSAKELLTAIAEYLLHSDFEEAAKLAKDYAENKDTRQAQKPL